MPLRAFEETADLGRGALNNELNQPGHLPTAISVHNLSYCARTRLT